MTSCGALRAPNITLTPYAQVRVLKKTQQRYPISETGFIFKLRFLILIKAQLSEYPHPDKINYSPVYMCATWDIYYITVGNNCLASPSMLALISRRP